jgi:hypothetical protein
MLIKAPGFSLVLFLSLFLQFPGNQMKLRGQPSSIAMIGQKYCPFCKAAALKTCGHLALACEGREFVRRCVEICHGQASWKRLCDARRTHLGRTGEWTPEREDFTWLETAFCNEFLKHLTWFGGIDYEWRTGPKGDHGGFWVLLWSREPQRLWWELNDEFERQHAACLLPPVPISSGIGPRRAGSEFQFHSSTKHA